MEQGHTDYTPIQRNHHTEDVIEENENEFNPHEEYYAGVENTQGNTYENTVNSQRQPLTSESNPHRDLITETITFESMPAVPGPCLRGFLDISSFLLCLFFIIVQHGLFDYYYVTNLTDKIWYAWLAGDSILLIALIWLTVIGVRHSQRHMRQTSSVDGKLKYAWIAWILYSLLLVGKIATCFRLFHEEIPPIPLDNNNKLFDDHLFRLGLSLSVLVFLLLLEAHHYTPNYSNRQTYISYLATAVAFDLIDAICFLDLLWKSFKDNWQLPLWLDITILAVACSNFVLPAFTLLRLRFHKLPHHFLVSEKIWSLLYVLLVNGPFLGLRIYLYIILEVEQRDRHYDASLFVVKNVAMIYLAVREVWTRLHYWRQKRQYDDHKPLAPVHTDEEQ
ncbi:hypothetical protein QR680_002991 [Steinernema hermaphroditum]|uniref:Uncharacterized protein n=1 Tax=Steinernema hermaphroditum TaxID=289476 RepID=A0AA39LJE6_9BILA|nr:hypothetical protein QR680_002991 [Steinernema hermaphroditum]